MRRSITYLLVGGIGLGWGLGSLHSVAAEEACHAAPPSPRQVYRQEQQSKIQQLQTQIQALQTQLKSATDPSVKQQLRAQLKTLDEQKCTFMIDLAQHQVQWDEEDITAAEKRLETAKATLEKLQAHEAEMERKKL